MGGVKILFFFNFVKKNLHCVVADALQEIYIHINHLATVYQ